MFFSMKKLEPKLSVLHPFDGVRVRDQGGLLKVLFPFFLAFFFLCFTERFLVSLLCPLLFRLFCQLPIDFLLSWNFPSQLSNFLK